MALDPERKLHTCCASFYMGIFPFVFSLKVPSLRISMSYGDGLRYGPHTAAEHASLPRRLKRIKACPCRLELEARLGGYQQRPAVTCTVYRT